MMGEKMVVKNQNGTSLVEVMVALFVLAIGLLGMLAMQSRSMQYNQSAHVYSQAVYLANDIAERIRNNPGFSSDPAFSTKYVIAAADDAPAEVDCTGAACDPDRLAQWDKFQLFKNVKALPAGDVLIESPQPRTFRIEVSFDDSRSEGKEAAARKAYALLVGI